MRQFANEADGVGHERLRILPKRDFASQWVERREQAILDEDLLRAGQRAQNRGLARVGIANERRLEFAPARAALDSPSLLELAQLIAHDLDPVVDQSSIRLELGFAGSPHADAAAELLQVGPHARQPRQRILEVRELD